MLPIYLFIASYVVLSRVLPKVVRYWRTTRQLRLSRRIVVFSRFPTAGKTKTRLIPTLGASGAAGLQLLMTDHLLDTFSKPSLPDLCLELRYYGGYPNQLEYWIERRKEPIVICRPQTWSKDLGGKMAGAFRDAFDEGAKFVVVVGSDIPGISGQITKEAFEMLEKNEAEMVLGPAKDGGYYLVGLSAQTANHLSDIFCGMEWGTDKVLQQQVAVARKLGLNLKLLTTKLSDVDVEGDLHEVERCIGVTAADMLRPRWSIVIPILNERANIERAVRSLVERADAPDRLEIVIADGGSEDHPEEEVERLSKELKQTGTLLKLMSCPRGRGLQLNSGAAGSEHKLLLFLHIDTILPKHYDTMAWHTLLIPGVTAGAFQFGLDVVHMKEKRQHKSWWFLQQMRLLEWGTQKRISKYEMPYGDQGLFMWRRTFDKLGGYPQFKLMEDYEMISRIKKIGHVKIVTGPPALTSARRWEKHGYIRVTSFNSFIIFAYKCGVSPDTLARWYYGRR